jgi:hypothetical protein
MQSVGANRVSEADIALAVPRTSRAQGLRPTSLVTSLLPFKPHPTSGHRVSSAMDETHKPEVPTRHFRNRVKHQRSARGRWCCLAPDRWQSEP